MTYLQFVHAVETNLKEGVRDELSVTVCSTQKNNGIIRHGLSIAEKGTNVAPTIYLEEYYARFLQGSPIEKITGDILELYSTIRFHGSIDGDFLMDFEQVKEKIVFRVVNWTYNQDLLEDVPHVRYLDLAVIFYVMLDVTNYGSAGMMIRDEHAEKWYVSADTLYQYALQNSERIMGFTLCTMEQMLHMISDEHVPIEDNPMYVLTNTVRNFGASAILYPGKLAQIRKEVGDDYYVLPSSVHELIIIPEYMADDPRGLKEMVQEVNQTEVDDEEVLSDNIYYYSMEKEKLSLVHFS